MVWRIKDEKIKWNRKIKMQGSMSRKEAIEEMGCKKGKCEHLDENATYSFCSVIFTKDFCRTKKEEINKFYKMAKQYGFGVE